MWARKLAWWNTNFVTDGTKTDENNKKKPLVLHHKKFDKENREFGTEIWDQLPILAPEQSEQPVQPHRHRVVSPKNWRICLVGLIFLFQVKCKLGIGRHHIMLYIDGEVIGM